MDTTSTYNGRSGVPGCSRPGHLIKEDGERRGIIVIPLSRFYLSEWSTCNYFPRAFLSLIPRALSPPGSAIRRPPRRLGPFLPRSCSSHSVLDAALRPPEARQFCRFKLVEVIKLLKRSLGFASFPGSPPFPPFSRSLPSRRPSSVSSRRPFSSTITGNVSKE